jgi:hypothetical protein
MAFSHGTTAVLKVADSIPTLRDLSAYLTEETLQRTAGAEDVTTQGKTVKVYIPGLADGTIPLSGKFDPTVDGYLNSILNLATTYEYYPAGTPVGPTKPKYAGAAVLTAYEVKTGVSGAASFTATLQLSDTVGRTVA